jgi:hypothetical protein
MWTKFICASLLAATLSACQTAEPLPSAGALTGLKAEGNCVVRSISVFDRQSGQMVDVDQRFCGGRVRITP